MTTPASIEILSRLVGFPTVSRDSNLPLIDWVRNYLQDLGIESTLVHDATGRKANLFASVGPAAEGGLVFSGHSDVVPTDGQQWSCDPFQLTERGSRLYARGACDMKGFIACVLAHIPQWRLWELQRPVHLMLSYDEELGCLGAPSLVAAARAALPKPGAVIVGEPTSMRLANRHKGVCRFHTRVGGIEAHSSLTHLGVSAVMLAGELIAELGAIGHGLTAGLPSGGSGFDPPYTTLSINTIHGGTAANILAAQCDFTWEVRAVPGVPVEEVTRRFGEFSSSRLARLAQEGKICIINTSIEANAPPLRPDESTAERLVEALLDGVAPPIAVSFGTEAGLFQGVGWSTVVCGPGSIEQAHKPDEFLERQQLMECDAFLDAAVLRHCVRCE